MPNLIHDITGQRFGSLVALKRTGLYVRTSVWLCRCDCGNETEVLLHNLRKGMTQSCGQHPKNVRHGKSDQPIFQIWWSMLARCHDPKNPNFKNYGARGIQVCVRWWDFEYFYGDMGDRPKDRCLERIDNDGPYSPQNCRWATAHDQSRNTRRTRFFTIGDRTLCMKDWAHEYGVAYLTLKSRIDREGLPLLEALTRPNRYRSRDERAGLVKQRIELLQRELPQEPSAE